MNNCGCICVCHEAECDIDWPGPCAGCCEPGDDCDCGRATAYLAHPVTFTPAPEVCPTCKLPWDAHLA